MSDALIRHYYQCFNERRFADAAAMCADDALVENIPIGQPQRGPAGYLRFAEAWVGAFPNAVLSVKRAEQRRDTMCEVYLLATGTHRGILDLGVYRFKPTGVETRLHMRELLDIRDGKIVMSTLSVDLNDLINQLTTLDYDELARRLERIRALSDELSGAVGDAARQREVTDRLGPELDAARRALRPHFNR